MSKIVKLKELDSIAKDIYAKIKLKSPVSHTHTADQVTESSTRKFTTPQEKTSWNAKIDKTQLDEALNTLASGLTWKGSFTTLEELKKLQNPQDGWFAIVTTGQNKFYIYESTGAAWQDLGGLMLPGIATSSANGLMTKEMVVKLAGLINYTLPIGTTSVLGGVKSGSIITISNTGILTIDGQKLITNSERVKWNQATTDIGTALTSIVGINTSLSGLTTRVGETEKRITSIEGQIVFAQDSDIVEIINKYK